MTRQHFKVVIAFVITTLVMAVLNFFAQIVLIFMDAVSQFETSSALTIILWMVTGVFGAIFTEAAAGMFIDKKEITYPLIHAPVLIVSMLMIVLAGVLMSQGEFIADPSDFTLLFSNGFVFISYFLGAGGFAFIGRRLQ